MLALGETGIVGGPEGKKSKSGAGREVTQKKMKLSLQHHT